MGKLISAVILLLSIFVIDSTAEDALIWNKYNSDQIVDLKSLIIDNNNALLYSEYNSGQNIWRYRISNSSGKDSLLSMLGMNNSDRIIINNGDKYAISQDGKLYKYNANSAIWQSIPLPEANYQAADLIFSGDKMLLLPKYGSVYRANVSNGIWEPLPGNYFNNGFYNGEAFADTIYIVANSNLYRSINQGTNWEIISVPEGIDGFVEMIVNNDELYICDNNNKIYKVNGSSLEFIVSIPEKVFGLAFNSLHELFISTNKGIYRYTLSDSQLSKVFNYEREIAYSKLNNFKDRAVSRNSTIYFAVPNNEIVYSDDNGESWQYKRKDLQYASVDKLAAFDNQLIAMVDTTIYLSDFNDRVWVSTKGYSDASLVSDIKFSQDTVAFIALGMHGIRSLQRNSILWDSIVLPNEYSNVKSIEFLDPNSFLLLTDNGLVRTNYLFNQWALINQNIKIGKLKRSNDKIFWIKDSTAAEIDSDGNILNTLSLVFSHQAKINDITSVGDKTYIATTKGLFTYDANSSPAYTIINKGIYPNPILAIDTYGNRILAYDSFNNIYISNSAKTKFSNYRLPIASLKVSGLTKNFNDRVIVSSNSGAWYFDSINDAIIEQDEYWTINNDFLLHSSYRDKLLLMKPAINDSSFFVFNNLSDASMFSNININSGRESNSITLSDYNPIQCDIISLVQSADVNSENSYIAIAFDQQCNNLMMDSLSIISVDNHKVLNNIPLITDTDINIFDRVSTHLLFKNNSELLTAVSNKIIKANSDTIEVSTIRINNIYSGQSIHNIELPKDLNGSSGRITSIQNFRASQGFAVAISSKDSNSIVLYDKNNTQYNRYVKYSKNTDIQKILFNNNNKKIIYSKVVNSPTDGNSLSSVESIDLASNKIKSRNNLRIIDMAYSIDSNTIIATVIVNESNTLHYKLLSLDFNSLETLNQIDLDENTIGNLLIDRLNDRIIVCGNDGKLRSFNSIRPLNQLKAEFTSDDKIVVIEDLVQFNNLSTGSPLAFEWNFGDGTKSNLKNPTHSYKNQGIYTVTLKVWRDGLSSVSQRTDYIKVLSSSHVDYTANKVDGFIPMTVQFKEEFAGELLNRHWDFGDGSFGNIANPTHTYTKVGKYTVTLIADNGIKTDTIIKHNMINVDAIPTSMIIDFTADKQSGILPLTVKFTPSSTPSSTYWEWDFGDGTKSTDQYPSHTYTEYGNYTVTLKSGKEQYSSSIIKPVFIRVLRGGLEWLNVVQEYELSITNGEKIGLSACQVNDNAIGLDIAVDSAKNKFSEFGLIDLNTKNLKQTSLKNLINKADNKHLIATENIGFSMFYPVNTNGYDNVTISKRDDKGNLTQSFIARRNQNMRPVASLSEGQDILVASVADDSLLVINKFNSENQFIIDKELEDKFEFESEFVHIIRQNDKYLVFIKENDNTVLQVYYLDLNGEFIEKRNMYEKAYYNISDLYVDKDGFIIAAGAYRFSKELSPVYSFIAKYDNELNQILFTQITGGVELYSITEVIDKYKHKKYIAAGSIEGNAGFLSYDLNMDLVDRWKLDNRIGKFNDALSLRNSELILTGNLYNQYDRSNLYILHLSANNTYSDIEDEELLQDISVFPNPSTGIVKIEYSEAFSSIKLFNALGSCVFTQENIDNNIYEADLNNLSSGIYYLEVSGIGFSNKKTMIIITK